MTTSTVTPEIVSFAQGVRAALADLPAEEVDELTDGLEADLAEAYAEDLQRELPDPAAYAAELRLAAGLPVRSKVKHGLVAGLGQNWRDMRADLAVAIRRNPALAAAVDFLGELRPVWWVVRAWLAAWLVAAFFGSEQRYGVQGGWWIVMLAFIMISVQWGRGRWHFNGTPALIVIGNVVAIVALLPVMAAASSDDSYVDSYPSGPESSVGITLDGASVTNIFAYGADGKPLTDVQLFDQDGRPLAAHLDPYRDECGDGGQCKFSADGLTGAPTQLETGASVRNVFPLSFIEGLIDETTGEMRDDPQAVPTAATRPFVKVPALLLPEKVAEPAP